MGHLGVLLDFCGWDARRLQDSPLTWMRGSSNSDSSASRGEHGILSVGAGCGASELRRSPYPELDLGFVRSPLVCLRPERDGDGATVQNPPGRSVVDGSETEERFQTLRCCRRRVEVHNEVYMPFHFSGHVGGPKGWFEPGSGADRSVAGAG